MKNVGYGWLQTRCLCPEGVWESLLAYMSDRLCVVDFSAVGASEAAPPHPVDEPQRQVGYEEDDDAVDGRVRVDDEDEIVYVNHLVKRPPGLFETVVESCVE